MMIFYNCNSEILFYYNIILHGKSMYLIVLQVSSLKTVHKSALYRKMVFSKIQNLRNFDFLTNTDQDIYQWKFKIRKSFASELLKKRHVFPKCGLYLGHDPLSFLVLYCQSGFFLRISVKSSVIIPRTPAVNLV